MSAPLVLTPEQLQQIADALNRFSEIASDHGVLIGGYSQMEIHHREADVVLAVAWDETNGYRIDDRSGS